MQHIHPPTAAPLTPPHCESFLGSLGTTLREAETCNRLEELLDLAGAAYKVVAPQVVGGVLDELDEGDEEAPGMRLVDDEALD